MVAKISRINSPIEPTTDSATIFRLRDAATNRFASGESLVKSPTRLRATFCEALGASLTGRFGATLEIRFETGLAAFLAAASRLGASGVTVAGVLGNALLPLFFAGPGRFNLVL